jgi:ribosome-binding factor A
MTSSEPGLRARRVAASVRERLTQLLATEVSDPLLVSVVLTDVQMPDDLSVVWIKARLLVGGDDPEKRKAVVKSLSRAAGRLRKGIGRSLRLRRLPELRFSYDTGVDSSQRVEELLEEIRREPKSS